MFNIVLILLRRKFIPPFYDTYCDIIIRRPLLLFDYQAIIQKEFKKDIFEDPNTKINGVKITLINQSYYLNKYIPKNTILVKINNEDIEDNGYIKIKNYPEKIPIHDIGLWFKDQDEITLSLYNNGIIINHTFRLQIIKTNLLYYYNLPNIPKYYINKNGLVLSIITNQHFKKLKDF